MITKSQCDRSLRRWHSDDISLYVKRLSENATLPTKSYQSAGYDLYASADITLPPGKVTPVPLDIATEIPEGYAALVWDRSSLGKYGLHVFGGVIDADYRGPWFVLLFNSTDKPFEVSGGDRVAQFVIQRAENFRPVEVQELCGTSRGQGAFGSTGR